MKIILEILIEISNHRKDYFYNQFKKITKDFKNIKKIGILVSL